MDNETKNLMVEFLLDNRKIFNESLLQYSKEIHDETKDMNEKNFNVDKLLYLLLIQKSKIDELFIEQSKKFTDNFSKSFNM